MKKGDAAYTTKTENINLNIAGKKYPFSLHHSEDEIYFRNAQTLINKKFYELNEQYGTLFNDRDRLALIAVDALLDALKLQENYRQLQQNVFERISRLEKEVSLN